MQTNSLKKPNIEFRGVRPGKYIEQRAENYIYINPAEIGLPKEYPITAVNEKFWKNYIAQCKQLSYSEIKSNMRIIKSELTRTSDLSKKTALIVQYACLREASIILGY